MVMAYCEVMHQNSLSKLEILELIIDVNLANMYLLTSFYFKNNSQNHCHLYVGDSILKQLDNFKKEKIVVKLAS